MDVRRLNLIQWSISLVFLFGMPDFIQAEDWPNWLGKHHDGISREVNWQSDWAKSKPSILWRAKVGLGFSSVAVSNGRLFTMGHKGGNEIVFCLDAKTGKELWRKEYPCALINRFYEGGSSSTPTVDGDRVYTIGKEGQFKCFNASDGKEHWSLDLRKELESRTPEWGFAASALIQDGHVVVQAARIGAFDKQTGKKLWESESFKQGYGTPTPFVHDGKKRLAVLNNRTVVVLDATDGKTLASAPWRTSFDTNSSSPIVIDDSIFISTGYGKGCALFRFTGTALEQRYASKDMANHMNNCVLHKGHLFGFHGNSNRKGALELRCIEWETGKLKWSQGGLGCGALTLANGKLIVMSDRGDLVLAEASSAAFKELGRVERAVSGKVWTMPILANGMIYCRSTPGNLSCVDVSGKSASKN